MWLIVAMVIIKTTMTPFGDFLLLTDKVIKMYEVRYAAFDEKKPPVPIGAPAGRIFSFCYVRFEERERPVN